MSYFSGPSRNSTGSVTTTGGIFSGVLDFFADRDVDKRQREATQEAFEAQERLSAIQSQQVADNIVLAGAVGIGVIGVGFAVGVVKKLIG